MTAEEERALAELLAKKKAEEARTYYSNARGGPCENCSKPLGEHTGELDRCPSSAPPVLQLLQGGGEKNKMADKIAEFAAMARRGELFDYAIVVVKSDGVTASAAWGSQVPSLQICGAIGMLQVNVVAALRRS